MEKQKHTPGPWEVCQPCYEVKNDPIFWTQAVKSGGKQVARAVGIGVDEAQANAALIAAAPELLEACKWFLMACEDIQEGQAKGYFEKAMRLGREAVKKAEGR